MIARKHWNGATTLSVTWLPFGLYIKEGFNAVEEVADTQYVEENTSIPVPHVFDFVSVGDPECPRLGLIVMQAVPEQHLGAQHEVLHELSTQQQDTFVENGSNSCGLYPPPDE